MNEFISFIFCLLIPYSQFIPPTPPRQNAKIARLVPSSLVLCFAVVSSEVTASEMTSAKRLPVTRNTSSSAALVSKILDNLFCYSSVIRRKGIANKQF